MTTNAIAELRRRYAWPASKPTCNYDLQGWCDESATRAILKHVKPGSVYAEIGSWFGCSTDLAAKTVGPGGTVIAIDTWEGSVEMRSNPRVSQSHEQFLRNLWEYRDIVIPVRNNSIDGLRELASIGIQPDTLFIDGSHEYEDVLNDLTLAVSLFPSTIIFGHDYDLDWTGVIRAVWKYCHENKYTYTVDRVTWTLHRDV